MFYRQYPSVESLQGGASQTLTEGEAWAIHGPFFSDRCQGDEKQRKRVMPNPNAEIEIGAVGGRNRKVGRWEAAGTLYTDESVELRGTCIDLSLSQSRD